MNVARVVLIGCLIVAGILAVAAILFLARRDAIQHPGDIIFEPSPANEEKCVTEIEGLTTPEELVVLGNRYFGGNQPFSILCARLAYTKAVGIDQNASPFAWHQLGRLDFLEGNFESAIVKFDAQIKYFGDTLPNVHYMLGLTYGYKARRDGTTADWEMAERSFKRYLELDPMSPWARVDLAWVFFSQGKYQEMKPILEESLLAHPRNPWLLNLYGLSLLNTDDREGAYIYFKAAKSEAAKLTAADWGAAYPGNDPASWEKGLHEMRTAIEKNYTLVAGEFGN